MAAQDPSTADVPCVPLYCAMYPHPPPAPTALSLQMSRLGGLTARVGQLLEALHGSAAPSRSSSSSRQAACMAADGDKHDLHAVRLSLDGNELQPSHFATLVQPPRMLRCATLCWRRVSVLQPHPLALHHWHPCCSL